MRRRSPPKRAVGSSRTRRRRRSKWRCGRRTESKVERQVDVERRGHKLRLESNIQANDFARQPGLLRWDGYRVGEMDDRGKVHTVDTKKTLLVDCGSWPPKESLLAKDQVSVIYNQTDGLKILHHVYHDIVKEKFMPRPSGVLRIERPKTPSVDVLDKLPDHFDVEAIGWVGELVVILPTEPTIRGKDGRRPLVWNGKTLSPAKGLTDATAPKGTPKDRWPSFVKAGFARTGNGTDVLIWEGQTFVAKGDAFVKVGELTADFARGRSILGASGPGESFFYVNERVIHQAEGGRAVARATLAHLPSNPPRTTFDGRVLVGLNRYAAPKQPVLAVFHPAANELTYVPPAMLAVRKDDPLDAYGVTPKTSKGDAYLWAWVLQDDELRRVSWSAILALPRVAADA